MSAGFDLPEYHQHVIDYLRSIGANGCPTCYGDRYEVQPVAVIRCLAQLSPDAPHLAHFLVPVECLKCGQVRLFNARTIGLSTPDQFDVGLDGR
jgi:hypothetical protein